MANVDRVNGFSPVGHLGSSGYNGQSREYAVAASYATALFVGDAVKLTGTGNSDGVPYVEQAAAGDTMVGVIVGIKVDRADLNTEHPGYSTASTVGTVSVCDDPKMVFEVQEDGNAGVVAIGNTFDHVVAAGSTTTGASGMEMDSSDVGTGAGWKVVGASRRTDNEPANSNAKWLVMINEHSFDSAVAGV